MTINDIRSAKKYKQTVLIVEDQLTVQRIHGAVIKRIPNVEGIPMQDPLEALNWMKNRPVDLILTDYLMENMNGVDFIKAAKLTKFGANTPIIVITANTKIEVHAQLYTAGALIVLIKPRNPFELQKICEDILEDMRRAYLT